MSSPSSRSMILRWTAGIMFVRWIMTSRSSELSVRTSSPFMSSSERAETKSHMLPIVPACLQVLGPVRRAKTSARPTRTWRRPSTNAISFKSGSQICSFSLLTACGKPQWWASTSRGPGCKPHWSFKFCSSSSGVYGRELLSTTATFCPVPSVAPNRPARRAKRRMGLFNSDNPLTNGSLAPTGTPPASSIQTRIKPRT